MGTQKNRLNETVLLSTQNICWNWWERKHLQLYPENLCLSKPEVIEKLHCTVLVKMSIFLPSAEKHCEKGQREILWCFMTKFLAISLRKDECSLNMNRKNETYCFFPWNNVFCIKLLQCFATKIRLLKHWICSLLLQKMAANRWDFFFSLQAWYLYKILRDLKIQTCYNGPCSMLKEMFGMLSQFGR